MVDLDRLFRTPNSDRDAFLSRLFGIFNEDIVRIWCRDPRSPYNDLGRPTIFQTNTKGFSTLDFCLLDYQTGQAYVSEMKCELQYNNYKYLTLESPDQLNHHEKPAFSAFLETTRNPNHAVVKVNQKSVIVSGGILIWGRTTNQGRSAVIAKFGFTNVLSLEMIVIDLLQWENSEFHSFVETRSGWCDELFTGIRGSLVKSGR
jgi:hypothetical protein